MFDPSTLFADTSRYARLLDGSRYRIRAISKTDRHLLVAFFERLSPNSRRMRFLAAKRSLTEKDLDFLTSTDGYDHIALAAVKMSASGQEEQALGFARCIRSGQAPELAEMSIAVADEVQRLGVGSALLDQLKRLAGSVNIRRFVCEALAENPGMRALATQMGGEVRWNGDGIVEYEWPVSDDLPTEEPFWSAYSHREISESVEFWWTLIGRSVSLGIQYYQALLNRYYIGPGSQKAPSS